MATKVQLINGGFQDAEGNPLAGGYLLMYLSSDGQANAAVQVAAGTVVKILLDSSGNVVASPAQNVWPNSAILPANTTYFVSAYTASGQLVWGPNAVTVGSSNPYDIGAGWVP